MLDALDDEALMRRTGSGDHAAFATLVARHRRPAMRLALRIAGSQGDAEEIVQEAFTRTWVKAPGWQARTAEGREDGGGSFAAWLARVVANLAIDRLRRRPREAAPMDAAAELPSADPSPLEQVAGEQARQRIEAALRALPERQRAAVALCRMEGMSNAAAAKALDVSVGGLEMLLVRARRTLRATLADLIEVQR